MNKVIEYKEHFFHASLPLDHALTIKKNYFLKKKNHAHFCRDFLGEATRVQHQRLSVEE